MVLGNCLISAGILSDNVLRNRKEYIPVAGMALADIIDGSAYLIAGVRRLLLFALPPPTALATGVDCILKAPHAALFMFSAAIQPVMFLVISVDRFLAVAFPLAYNGWGLKYGLRLSGGACTSVVGYWILGMALALTSEVCRVPKYSWTCNASYIVTPGYKTVYVSLTLYIAVASVLLYGVLLIVYWWKNKVSGVVHQDEQQKRQKRMTKTLGMSCAFTLVFFCLPHVVRVYLFALKHTPANISAMLAFGGAFKNINSLTVFGKKVFPSVAKNQGLPILH